MIDVRTMAMTIIKNNPQIANNPRAQELVKVIESGDQAKGEQIALNLCNSYGVTPDQATKDAKRFFNIP